LKRTQYIFWIRKVILKIIDKNDCTALIKNSVVISVLSFFVLIQSKAQSFEEKNFALYTRENGLSNNEISYVTQDAFGYLWIGTKKGLNRFDGNSFVQFYSDSSDNSLPSDWVYRLKWINKESIAISTGTGLCIVNTRTLQTHNLFIKGDRQESRFIFSHIQGIAADDDGNIFLLTSAGFYQFNNKEELIFRYDHYNRDFAATHSVSFGRNLAILPGNILLLSTTKGPYIYDKSKKKLNPIDGKDDPFYLQVAAPGEWFWIMHTDNNSFSTQKEGGKNLTYYDTGRKMKYIIYSSQPTTGLFDWRSRFFRLNDSLYAINGKNKGFYLVRYDHSQDSYWLESKLYFENYFVSSLFVDKNKRYWIGTNKGLFREKRQTGTIEKSIVPQQWNIYNRDLAIQMITIADDKIFAGTNGEGMIVYEREKMNVIKKIDFSKNGTLANYLPGIITLNKDTIIAGTYEGLAWVSTKNFIQKEINLPGWDTLHFSINTMFKDSRNTIYASRNASNVFYYLKPGENTFKLSDHSDNKLFRIQNPVNITEDTEGNIWFSAAGISRLNYHSQKIDKLLDSFPYIKIRRKDVLSLALDKTGKMYIGLKENGLAIYDPSQNKFEHLTRSNGLPDNSIPAIYIYKNKVWLGTESGLANYDIITKKISVFDEPDGMPADPFTASTFYFDSLHHQLYGAFNNTIVRFNPDELNKNSSPPEFFIETIVIAGDKTIFHPDNKIGLSYMHNNVVVNLGVVNFEDAYQQQFAYRLVKNGDEPWQETGSQRSMIFSNLSPGEHRLQFKVFIKNNSWPEQIKEILIIIKPPFWRTTWFILLAIVIIFLILYTFYRLRINNIKQKANIDKQLAELEMKGLHAQMNPHFIFNSLNSIKEMILEDEKQNASRYLSKFAQLIRTNLEQSRQTFITVRQCIDHLQQYLEMEKIRFEGFSYTINIDEDLPDNIRMAPMLIQPLVENAIWHGMRNQAGDKKLNIRFYKSGEQLVCEIEDNGIGINQSTKDKAGSRHSHRSLGIQNISERLEVLNEKYSMNCSLSITDRSELPGNRKGTLAVLRFNI